MDEQKPQEVIAKWIKANTEHRQWYICPKCSYQAPRFKDEWVGMTNDELLDIADMVYVDDLELLQNLQAKLKEKNSEK
jgi:hypothetical protein